MVHTKYGPPEVVQLAEIAKPVPKDNEILIKVHATTVNRTDCGFRRADPVIARFFTGILRPKQTVMGSEFAGEVDTVGAGVTLFRTGDQVFGLTGGRFGAHAEYLCLAETGAVATKPANMTSQEATAIPDGAMLAWTDLKRANVQPGQAVLIYGASGAVGTAAVQLAKHLGAHVTGVCSTRHLELVSSLGADAVIDYTSGDFTETGQTYDIVFDAVGKTSFSRCKPIIKPGGIYIATDLGFLVQNPFLALWGRKFGDKRVIFPVPTPSKEQIVFFKELIEAGALRAVIDRSYPLEHIFEAYRYVELGHKTGNVVITVTTA